MMSLETELASKKWEWLEARAYTSILGGFDPPSHFAEAMAETIPIHEGETRLLDIGCGSGIIGIFSLVKKRAKFVTFVDILSEAMAVTFANVQWHIRQGSIEESQVGALKAGFAEIPPDVVSKHDLMAFNPPQLPWKWVSEEYKETIKGDPSQYVFRFGGEDGLCIVRKFLKWFSGSDGPKPPARMTLSSFLGRELIKKTIDSFGVGWEIADPGRRVPLRKILVDSAVKFCIAERRDRSLEKGPSGIWTKELQIISLKVRKES